MQVLNCNCKKGGRIKLLLVDSNFGGTSSTAHNNVWHHRNLDETHNCSIRAYSSSMNVLLVFLLDNKQLYLILCYTKLIGRVRNPKNQLLQIDPPNIVGCSLWYPIARSTMKPEARLLSSQKHRF